MALGSTPHCHGLTQDDCHNDHYGDIWETTDGASWNELANFEKHHMQIDDSVAASVWESPVHRIGVRVIFEKIFAGRRYFTRIYL